jgi:hypothetical protein
MNRNAFIHCVEAATFGGPVAGLHHIRATYVGPEVDQWLCPPMSWEVTSIMRPREDFTLLSDEGQRMFLLVAAQALYGAGYDEELLADCERIARAPI